MTVLRIDGSGRVTTILSTCFSCALWWWHNTNGTVIGWNSTDYNTGANYSTSTGRFTAPVDGKYALYEFGVAIWIADTASHQYFDIRKNGTRYQRIIGRWTVDGGSYLLKQWLT